jgi:glycosyltransferase involved in cell wall biosynthesis
MRILLQTYAFRPSWGGVQKFVLAFYRQLRDAGIKTVIATSSMIVISAKETYYASRADKKETELKRFNFTSVSLHRSSGNKGGARRYLHSLQLAFSYFRYCCFLFWYRPKVVHLIFINVDAWFAIRAKKLFQFKLLTSCRGSDILRYEEQNRFKQQLILETLEASDAISAVSHEIAGKVRRILNADISVQVIPNGIDLRTAPEKNASPKSDNFVFVGHMDENKNPEFLVNAFLAFQEKHRQYKLTMIGTGPLLNPLVDLVKNKSMGQVVEFTGGISSEAALEHIQTAIALILPSKNEGCPNVVLEAMYAGTPVIGSNRSGIKELIRNDHDGLLFEYNESRSLIECMERVVQSPELRSRLAQNGFQTLREKHDQQLLFQQYISLYENLSASTSL